MTEEDRDCNFFSRKEAGWEVESDQNEMRKGLTYEQETQSSARGMVRTDPFQLNGRALTAGNGACGGVLERL